MSSFYIMIILFTIEFVTKFTTINHVHMRFVFTSTLIAIYYINILYPNEIRTTKELHRSEADANARYQKVLISQLHAISRRSIKKGQAQKVKK